MGIFNNLKSSLFGPSVDYHELIRGGAVVVDVRSPQEFQGGHFKGSKNIPLSSLGTKVSKLKGKQVILVCRSGARAGQAKSLLSQKGIEAYNAGPWQRLTR